MSQNKNIVLVMGKPNSGKSASLMNMSNQDRYVYFNCDLKEIPFKDNFAVTVNIDDPMDILDYIQEVENNPDVDGAVIDTITFLMGTYERVYVNNAVDGRAAWKEYGDFYKELIHTIKAGTKNYIIMAHEDSIYNEQTLQYESKVPIKGAVGKLGVEADYTLIVSAKNVPTDELNKYQNDYLNITEDEEEDGSKRVFVTRTTKHTSGEKMRSPVGLWNRNELYIDNNVQFVFERIKEYYS